MNYKVIIQMLKFCNILLNYMRWILKVVPLLLFSGLTVAQETSGVQQPNEDLDLELGPIIVRAEHIPDEKRETAQIMSMISSEDFSVRGDSNIASAMRRVTGVSIAHGRFIYVRGLNERYNNATLNGSILPSPEPLRKVVPLDLFPTNIVETTIVQKTWSPIYSADFGGGLIDIRTKNVPLNNFYDLKVSSSSITGTNLATDGLHYKGGNWDWLGIDDGTRNLPANLKTAFENGTRRNDGNYAQLPRAQQNIISKELVSNSGLFLVEQGNVGMNFEVESTVGQRWDLNGVKSIGFLGVFSYSNEWLNKKGIQGIGEAAVRDGNFSGQVNQLSKFARQSTTNSIDLNGFASVGYDLDNNNRVKMLTFFTRSTDKVSEVSTGNTNDDDNIRREELEWIERQLWTNQIHGEHTLTTINNANLSWRGSWSTASRNAPFQIISRYEPVALDDTLVLRRGSGIEFSEIDDETYDYGIDIKMPASFGDVFFDLRAGVAQTRKSRQSFSNFLVTPNLNQTILKNLRVDVAYQTTFATSTTAFQTIRSTQSPSFYVASQDILATYLEADVELTAYMRIMFGIRNEEFEQTIETRSSPSDYGIITPSLQSNKTLPSTTFTWNFVDNFSLRLGYSETVNRPQFREVGPSRFNNTATNEQYTGNPFLKETEIVNWDARLEWYFGPKQFATIGVFKKNLEDPIEAFNVGSGESRLVTFVNIESANINGIEFEWRRDLPIDEWFNWSFLNDKTFSLDANLTLSSSSINASKPVLLLSQSAASRLVGELSRITGTSRFTLEQLRESNALEERTADFITNRQLQGHSKYLFNLQIGYYDEAADADLNLLLNYQSKRIRSVESLKDGTPAVSEELPITLDIVFKKRIDFWEREWSLGIKVENLFDSDYQAYQESGGHKVMVDTYAPGQKLNFSISRSF